MSSIKFSKEYKNIFWFNPKGELYKPRPEVVGEQEQLLDICRQMDKDKKNEKILRVGLTKLWWGGEVSTVWLGIDMSMNRMFNKKAKPIIFESMVFGRLGSSDLDCRRYSTRRQAREGHKRMVAEWSGFGKGLEGIKRSIEDKTYALKHWELERMWNKFRLKINHLHMSWLKGQQLFMKKLRDLIK